MGVEKQQPAQNNNESISEGAMKVLNSIYFLLVLIFLISCSGSGEETQPPTPDPEIYFGTWTWVSGDNIRDQSGFYGEKDVASPFNSPGGRFTANSWHDNQGNAWVFGGDGYGSALLRGVLNDLWRWDGVNWTWVAGSQSINQPGSYGNLGESSENNMPGARTNSTIWSDNSGNVWLFGGVGYDSDSNLGWLNDLWLWDGSTWTWLAGSNVINQSGVSGQASGNTPGARTSAQPWMAANGDLWLFAGGGYDIDGLNGDLNDMWRWDGSSWALVSDTSIANERGEYGIKNIAAATNLPGGRVWSVSWQDSAGDFWVFGGQGRDSQGVQGQLNDLWRWDSNNWTWISGGTMADQAGTYGTKGSTTNSNIPGGRSAAVSWLDSMGKVWIFGGRTKGSNKLSGQLNDLWVWDGLNWTWMSGSDEVELAGAVFGTKGVAAGSNRPSGRTDPVAWIDDNDYLWLFSGSGYDANGRSGRMNDLWRYEPE